MRIISRKALREFGDEHDDAKGPLDSWYHIVKEAEWRTPQDVKDKFGAASFLKDRRIVFNIGGNKYRVIVKVNYDYGQVFIRFVGTHEEYGKINAEEV